MRPRLLALFALLLLPLAGCGRVHYRYYVRLDDRPLRMDLPLDLVYAHPRIEAIKDRTLEVHVLSPLDSVMASTAKMTKPDDWETYYETWRRDFENVLADKIWRTAIFSDVGTPSDPVPLEKPDYQLRVAVTEWNEGNRWLRWILGFGAGRTRVQWEGKLVNAANGEELLLFADAREHPGGPYMIGVSFHPPKGNALIAQDLAWASRDLANALREATGIDREPLGTNSFHRKYRYDNWQSQEIPRPTEEIRPPSLRVRVGGGT
ncbi:MAG TPA: DUF4410 domain-containing protein [Candidatus Sumerlaeota bacterium]|nr:MAG: hypothetical protein BWZ08_00542 [candidate division BRC1 bacterium ADurb.BinA292]HOE97582.1 DUF4410 domain-containing protein [Candidatus Sumerlaeota bacterium]HOR29112.1 DUF4410 domain-containing protein [Candidatus Sumerlaeota bacterium]HPK00819.1 DUF4410 domain-containing protein [Candidatus Sumerlaeota bacterium]